MGLEDFEKELAAGKSREEGDEKRERKHRSRHDRDKDEDRERRHRHHHRSHRHRGDEEDRDRRHRHKRHRDQDEDGERRHRHSKRHRSDSPKQEPEPPADDDVKVFDSDGAEDEWVEKEVETAPPEEQTLDERGEDLKESKVQRDAWMQEPSALGIDYVQSKKPKAPQGQFVGAKGNHEFKVQTAEVNQHLADLQRDFDDDEEEDPEKVDETEPAQHEVSYTFGDSGSSWRMTKLKNVYRQAEESGRKLDDVALERYGDLRDFDDAREEEAEVDRRKMYGKDYVGKEKPSGELFQERKMKAGIRRESGNAGDKPGDLPDRLPPQGEKMEEAEAPATTAPLDATSLNKLKAQMMKAKMRNDPNAGAIEEEYNRAAAAGLANSA